MSLEHALRSVAALHDLPRLAGALGREPFWDEVPVEGWLGGSSWRSVVHRAAIFASERGLAWYGVEAGADPTRVARGVAGWLNDRGRPAVVAALDPPGRRLALAVAFGAVPVLEVDLDAPRRVELACLARAAGAADGP
ncbi:MAG TPA: hypothetical protein VNK43_07955, partial [Gemmatimonadales bacterium]|nr:hypothetical protein [Gemmatimonadales bacterium]